MSEPNVSANPECIVVMGVSGCGKSTFGMALAAGLQTEFIDGDDLHPGSNVAKMSRGEALTDEDRAPWLASINTRASQSLNQHRSIVIVCSALKKRYRDNFRAHIKPLKFVFLDGDFDLIQQRMEARKGHFMKADMLKSQFATLERPDESEPDVLQADIRLSVEELVTAVISTLPCVKSC